MAMIASSGAKKRCFKFLFLLFLDFSGGLRLPELRASSSSNSVKQGVDRRALLCGCGVCSVGAASLALRLGGDAKFSAALQASERDEETRFARVMAFGMRDYERRDDVVALKKKLFEEVRPGSSVLEIGVGAGPNLAYYARNAKSVVAVEPNRAFETFARTSADAAQLKNFDILEGFAEDLPTRSNSVDAVVCTMVLCSVTSVAQTLKEVHRVLKPGGKFLFVEHVSAPKDWKLLGLAQTVVEPIQVSRAGNCHFRRDPEVAIRRQFGDGNYAGERFVLDGCGAAPPWPPHFLLAPHLSGVATKQA